MKRVLIITADDFGFSFERNKGVMETFNNGAIKSASILLNCTGTEEVVKLVKSSNICPGLHLNLSEGVPIGKETYETLTTQTGIFKGKFDLRKELDLKQIDVEEIRREIHCQIEKFKTLFGAPPVYVDGHQHFHLHPEVVTVFAEALKSHNIKVTRYPIELNMESKKWINPVLMPFFLNMIESTRESKSVLDHYGIRTTDYFVGLSTMGADMTAERLKMIILEAFEDGENAKLSESEVTTCELMCHPGYPTSKEFGGFSWGTDEFARSDERVHELRVLSSDEMKEFYSSNKIELANHCVLAK